MDGKKETIKFLKDWALKTNYSIVVDHIKTLIQDMQGNKCL